MVRFFMVRFFMVRFLLVAFFFGDATTFLRCFERVFLRLDFVIIRFFFLAMDSTCLKMDGLNTIAPGR